MLSAQLKVRLLAQLSEAQLNLPETASVAQLQQQCGAQLQMLALVKHRRRQQQKQRRVNDRCQEKLELLRSRLELLAQPSGAQQGMVSAQLRLKMLKQPSAAQLKLLPELSRARLTLPATASLPQLQQQTGTQLQMLLLAEACRTSL